MKRNARHAFSRSGRLKQLRATALASLLAVGGCAQMPGAVTGSAGGSTSVGANGAVTRCPETLGTIAIDDGRRESWYGAFVSATQITTVEPLIRLVIQQSNCFVITTVGSMDLEGATNRIRGIQRSDEFRAGSRQGKGQRVAADYFLQPAILFAGAPTGGFGGGLGGFIPGGYGALLGGVAGGMSQNSTSVTMSLFDLRSGVQIAASEGSASASNFAGTLAGLGFGGGGGGGGALAAYQRTPAGQTTVASFVDAYDKLVQSMLNYQAQDVRGGLGRGGRMRVN